MTFSRRITPSGLRRLASASVAAAAAPGEFFVLPPTPIGAPPDAPRWLPLNGLF